MQAAALGLLPQRGLGSSPCESRQRCRGRTSRLGLCRRGMICLIEHAGGSFWLLRGSSRQLHGARQAQEALHVLLALLACTACVRGGVEQGL